MLIQSLLMVPMEMTPLLDTECASTVDFGVLDHAEVVVPVVLAVDLKMELGIAYFDSKHG